MKALFLALLFTGGAFASAQKCDTVITISEIIVPLNIIEEFLNPARNSGFLYLPFPSDTCRKNASTIRLTEPTGRRVAEFEVKEAWTGQFIEATFLREPKSAASLFKDVLRKKGLSEYAAAEVLLRALYPKIPVPGNKTMRVLKGVPRVEPGYMPTAWDENAAKKESLLKVVNYGEVINAVGRRDSLILDITQTPRDKNVNWRIPGSVQVPRMSDRDPPTRMTFNEISRYWASTDRRFLPKDVNAKIILYGYPHAVVPALNAIEWLQLAGYQNLFWFAGGASEWNDRPSTREQQWDEFEIITAQKLLSVPGDKTLILDVRSQSAYATAHIAGAVSGPVRTYKQKQLPANLLKGPKPPRGEYNLVAYPFSKEDLSKTIIVYADDEGDERAIQAARSVSQSYRIKPQIYRAGFADWQSHRQWLGTQYGVEAAKPSVPSPPATPKSSREKVR